MFNFFRRQSYKGTSIKNEAVTIEENLQCEVIAVEPEHLEPEMLKKEFTDNYITHHHCLKTINVAFSMYRKFYFYEDIEDSTLYKLFEYLYSLTSGIDSIAEYEKFIASEIKPLFMNFFGSIYNIEDNWNVLESLYRSTNNGSYILEYATFQKSILDLYSEIEEAQNDIIDLTFLRNLVLVKLFACVVALNRLFVISRNQDKLLNHDELNTIRVNLHEQFNDDYNIIFEKISPLYNKFYNKVFDDRFTCSDLICLIRIINEKDHKGAFPFLHEDCDRIIMHLRKTHDQLDYDIIVKGLLEFIPEYDWSGLARKLGVDMTVTFYVFYSTLIEKAVPLLSLDGLYKSIYCDNDIAKKFKEFYEELELIQEKERYLKGDFTKEHNELAFNLARSNIITGEEFELYIKFIFEKLGYNVELTKATGDQGADLVLMKDNVKTVVQAKFYNNSVGNKAVQEVVAALKIYDAQIGIVVTNNRFTKAAIELAEANNIYLIDCDGLDSLVKSILDLSTT
ncbi:MAG: restriction endonuclease [Clostridiales bacterium]|nr:restriction endonuclease [Clostridiales bacterium]